MSFCVKFSFSHNHLSHNNFGTNSCLNGGLVAFLSSWPRTTKCFPSHEHALLGGTYDMWYCLDASEQTTCHVFIQEDLSTEWWGNGVRRCVNIHKLQENRMSACGQNFSIVFLLLDYLVLTSVFFILLQCEN